MPQVGRNDPCPCNSGRKYKKCCLATDVAAASFAERAHQTEARALDAAVPCLGDDGEILLDEMVYEDLLGSLRAKYPDMWSDLHPVHQTILDRHLREWAVAEGVWHTTECGRQRILDMVLQSSEPDAQLQADERAWLEELGRRPVGLFEVGRQVTPRQIELIDLLDAGAEPLVAHHWHLHEIVEPGEICIARPVRFEGEWYVTASVFPFQVMGLARALADVLRQEDLRSRMPATATPEEADFLLRRIRTKSLLDWWVQERLALDTPSRGVDPGATQTPSAQSGELGDDEAGVEWLTGQLKQALLDSLARGDAFDRHAPAAEPSARAGKPAHRGGHRRGVWVTDLRHFLDERGQIAAALTGAGRSIAEHVARIVVMTSGAARGEAVETGVRCRRRPGRVPCTGTIRASLDGKSDDVCWNCPECADRGVVSGWRGTLWDRSETRPALKAGDAGAFGEAAAATEITRVIYRRGFVSRYPVREPLGAVVLEGPTLTDAVRKAIRENRLLELRGAWGDPHAGSPIQVDALEIVLGTGTLHLTVYNRAIMMLQSDDDRYVRMHRVCCVIEPPKSRAERA